ncbi:hypothetical protein TVAG_434100 [Trichomonas vaginalis G3]|uniref:Uncharacterized protein n=1 Tax=Trichomonas vaginalis (strain ATCC PRA-98 / G3) TaxID=412133 RepID=A2DSJ3_TRIV3|nr:hypothetical protein TVAGG3_0375910 [Trichomonas vaginalis G3]EAY16573.1 hypothetical protein TVAG_434100 [Trichomonas vaginalis G3]KAI5532943.1 hypothetical protein TVAGG3_0375910 [Trichomonas vaginalis G3]|eukprot:XP_001328796.1 hypothetical protein [Trichomonas vaginalis G3]
MTIVRRIQVFLRRLFNKTLYYEKGKTLISFVNLLGEGSRFKARSSLIEVSLNFFSILKTHSFRHVEVKIEDLDLEILEHENSSQDSGKTTIEQWIIQKILSYILILITKSAKINLHNISVTVKGVKFRFQSMTVEFVRAQSNFSLDFSVTEISLAEEDPFAHIPSLNISFKGSMSSLKQFMTNFYRNFGIKIPLLTILYNEGRISTDTCQLHITCPDDEDVDAQLLIDKIELNLPVLDLHTKTLKVIITELNILDDVFEASRFLATRGELPLADIPSIKIDKSSWTFSNVDLYLSTTFLIDIGLLNRYFNGVSNPLEKKQEKVKPKFQYFMKSPFVNVTFALSDNHILKIPLKKVVFQKREISAKTAMIDVVFPQKTYNFLTARWAELNLAKPFFGLRAREADFTLHADFAEKSYINEVFSLISFVSKQIKGDVSAFRDKLPPTSRRFSMVFETGSVKYATTPLTDTITLSNVAKLEAVQQLRIRQEKAIQIMKARGTKTFNSEEFEQESKNQLFKLYREAFSKLPEPEEVLYSVLFKDLEWVWDGPAISNRENALEKLCVIDKNLEKSNIGRIVGGALTLNVKHTALNSRHSGTLLTMENIETSGWYLNAKKKGVSRKDFFHYKIHCDNRLTEFNVPGIACRTVHFFDFNMKTSKIVMKSIPDASEIKQDWKLGSTLWRQEKYKYKRIYMFDKYRIRYRWLFKVSAKDFIVQHHDIDNMYSQTAQMNFIMPDFTFSFDRRQFTIVASQFIVRANTENGMRSMFIFPAPNMTARIVSHNPLNADSRRPTFVPIDSYRITDTEYEPYAKYCSHTWSLHSTIDFGDGYLQINGDLLKSFIHKIIHKGSSINRYLKPQNFIRRTSTYPKFSFFDVSVMIPKLLMTMNNDKLRVKLTGDPLILKMSTDNGFKVTCNGNKSEILGTFLERKIFSVTVSHLDVSTKETIFIKIRSIIGEMTTDIMNQINEFGIEMPPPKKKNPLPMMTTEPELLKHFNTTKFILEIVESKLTLMLTDTESSCSLSANNFTFEKRKNDTQTSLNIIKSNIIDLHTHGLRPLFHLDKVQFLHASGLSSAMKLVTLQSLSVNFRPDDFDVFIPAFHAFSLKINLDDNKANKIAGRDSLISGSIGNVYVKFFHPDGTAMCDIELQQPNLYYLANLDDSAVINFSLNNLSAKDETQQDAFKDIFSCTSEQIFVDLRMKRAKRIMKRAVFERIKCKIAPFSASLSMPFIKNLIAIFPSADDLRALDIDQDDIEESPNEANQISEGGIPSPAIDDSVTEGAFFCREFILHPISANLNFRRKETGSFKEFLDRSFTYQGLHMYDIFGTKRQLTGYIKKNLKWTLIKALPGFILSKGKKAQQQNQTQLPKPKDMEN